jgi:hypothetical protein
MTSIPVRFTIYLCHSLHGKIFEQILIDIFYALAYNSDVGVSQP